MAHETCEEEPLSVLGVAASRGAVRSYIAGRFLAGEGPALPTIEPATERVLAKVITAQPHEVNEAVGAARRAFDDGPWPRMRATERATFLSELADGIEGRLDAIATLESRDTGLPLLFTRGGHIPKAIHQIRFFAEEASRAMGELYALDDAYLNLAVREPSGVVAVLAPWNAPLAIAATNVAAALCLGNCCVLKPSEHSPLTAAVLATAAAEADFPPGVLNVIFGPGDLTGETLVTSAGVDVISLTGSNATGGRVLRAAADGFRRVGLETGGKSATIVFADADMDAALDGAILTAFANNGEVCAAGSRILVEAVCYEAFVDAFCRRAESVRVGDPLNPDTELGPLISSSHLQRVQRCISGAVAEGARLAQGGGRPDRCDVGFFMRPTVLSEANNRMEISQREVFGPVVAMIPFDGKEESAVAIANDSDYGLAAYVWSRDSSKAMRVARAIRVGFVGVNAPFVRDPRAPFGGYKASGLGRVGGKYSLDTFSELKTLCLPTSPYALPRLGSGEPGSR